MSASLLTVWRAARARAVPFAGESAGYVVLLACEELALSPRRVELANLSLNPDGGVRTLGREPVAEAQTEAELRSLLGELLQVASSPGVGLLRAASREPSGSLRAFAVELQKALIPVNRAAARRALSRLCRETVRACENGKLAPLPGTPGRDPLPPPRPTAPPDPVAPSPLCPVAEVSEVLNEAKRAGWSVQIPAEHPTRPETVEARRRSGLAPGLELEDDATEQFAFALEPSLQGDPLPQVEPKSDALTPVMVPGPRSAGPGPMHLANQSGETGLSADGAPNSAAYPGMPPQKSDVRQLLGGFEVAQALADGELRDELKRWAGIEGTPAPKTRLGRP